MKEFQKYLIELLDNGRPMNIENLIDKIKSLPELEQYVIDGEYDSVQVKIPLDIIQKFFGIDQRKLEEIESNTDEYEGWMILDDNGIVSLGGAS